MNKVKYITNKELLAEIHKSKISFCYFSDETASRYDVIVGSLDDINEETVEQGCANRAKRLSVKGAPVYPADVDPETLIYRVMDTSHIPLDPNGKRKPRSSTAEGQFRTNFPAFKHYKKVDGKYVEIGRSHWKGNLDSGNFSVEHGKISNRLAEMFMLLVEKLARKGCWRGYCVDETTEALTKRGWLKYDEITTDDIILSYNEGKLVWSKIKSIFRDRYDGKMFQMESDGLDALVTPGHKFITQNGLKKIEFIAKDDQIILTGDPAETTQHNWTSDGDVEGTFTSSVLNGTLSKMVQSPVDGAKSVHQTFDVNKVAFEDVNLFSGKVDGGDNVPTVEYKGMVWCPETEYGSFMCRRNGKAYLTGNTYNDEMQAHALLHLSQTGLQFNEAKSDNPFSFYTTVVKHCFTRVLNLERRNQVIRDDLLIIAGAQPSFTRQVEHEMDIRQEEYHPGSVSNPVPVIPKKRGRKPKNAQVS